MSEHRYSLAEIDRMRSAIKRIHDLPYCYGRCMMPDGTISFSFAGQPKHAEIEDELRTYMLAGVRPEDLEKKHDDMKVKLEAAAWGEPNQRTA